jgi:hypothetical protein
MTTILSTNCRSVATATKGSLVPRLGLLVLAIVCVSTNAASATQFDFLSVSGNGLSGNAASTTFTSNNSNGVITVSHVFSSPAAVGYADNDNPLIFPSAFPTLFPGTGQVQGHLAMTVYGDPNSPLPGGNINTSQVIFTLNGYTGSLPNLVFGMWNTTSEVAQPAYRVELIDVNSNPQQPSMLNLLGNEDNVGAAGVPGQYDMVMNPNGDIVLGSLINASGTHTNAAFWDNIPVGTQQIIVYANLPPLNNIGDGVGYYFAEVVPEPSTFVLGALGLIGVTVLGWRRRGR